MKTQDVFFGFLELPSISGDSQVTLKEKIRKNIQAFILAAPLTLALSCCYGNFASVSITDLIVEWFFFIFDRFVSYKNEQIKKRTVILIKRRVF